MAANMRRLAAGVAGTAPAWRVVFMVTLLCSPRFSQGIPSPSELPLSYLLEETAREAASVVVHAQATADALGTCRSEWQDSICVSASRLFSQHPGTGVAYREVVWRLGHLPFTDSLPLIAMAQATESFPFAQYERFARSLFDLVARPATPDWVRRRVRDDVRLFLARDADSPHTLEQARARVHIYRIFFERNLWADKKILELESPSIGSLVSLMEIDIRPEFKKSAHREWAREILIASAVVPRD